MWVLDGRHVEDFRGFVVLWASIASVECIEAAPWSLRKGISRSGGVATTFKGRGERSSSLFFYIFVVF